jgi:hypothetical protein
MAEDMFGALKQLDHSKTIKKGQELMGESQNYFQDVMKGALKLNRPSNQV